MNLTEPQAGSDVGALRTTATPAGDGGWRIKGTKIFITFGEHDLTDNIIHLVLARTPGAPTGTKGISLFLVPKVLSDGTRNDLRCASIEHKLGIHASPTCVMIYGDHDECQGWLIGEEGAGMRAMFTMMNNARINVGLQGVSVAERATQAAFAYARERVQSARVSSGSPTPVTIIEHPHVRRMRAQTEAIRALLYASAAEMDRTRLGITGIQAADLVGRKLTGNNGAAMKALVADVQTEAQDLGLIRLASKVADLAQWLLAAPIYDRLAASAPFLTMTSVMVCAWLMERQNRAAAQSASDNGRTPFLRSKLATTQWYLAHIVPEALGLNAQVRAGATCLYEFE
ncbi:acyl-CoA dehydrogenase [Sphingobium sp. TKS]|uniref:acyl-CoA dehydrogenase n=1 Tax=Sphingobium sp. TKS TaxID=1315974 RepID=UPI000A9E1D61